MIAHLIFQINRIDEILIHYQFVNVNTLRNHTYDTHDQALNVYNATKSIYPLQIQFQPAHRKISLVDMCAALFLLNPITTRVHTLSFSISFFPSVNVLMPIVSSART